MLLKGKVRRDLAVRLQAVLLDDAHHAHNRHRLLRVKPQVFSDRATVWPKSLREFFINDGYLLFFCVSSVMKNRSVRSGISIVRK